MSRVGKIARLRGQIREQITPRLQDDNSELQSDRIIHFREDLAEEFWAREWGKDNVFELFLRHFRPFFPPSSYWLRLCRTVPFVGYCPDRAGSRQPALRRSD